MEYSFLFEFRNKEDEWGREIVRIAMGGRRLHGVETPLIATGIWWFFLTGLSADNNGGAGPPTKVEPDPLLPCQASGTAGGEPVPRDVPGMGQVRGPDPARGTSVSRPASAFF